MTNNPYEFVTPSYATEGLSEAVETLRAVLAAGFEAGATDGAAPLRELAEHLKNLGL